MLCKLQIICASFPYSFSKNDYYAIILCASFPIYSEIHCSYVCADSLVVTILLIITDLGIVHIIYQCINKPSFLFNTSCFVACKFVFVPRCLHHWCVFFLMFYSSATSQIFRSAGVVRLLWLLFKIITINICNKRLTDYTFKAL